MSTNIAPRTEHQPVAISDSESVLSFISRAASDPNVDVAKIEKYMDLYERILNKQGETEFNAAMTAAQSEMGRVSADATNPQTKSKYASYAKLDRALRPIYTNHGFALSFDEGDSPKDEHVRVLCYVSHRGGFSKTYHKDMPADGKGAKGGDVMTKTHAAGSAMSYGMRYLLKGIFNVAVGEEDDDGNGASESTITAKQAADLNALVDEVGANRAAFLKLCKVERFDQLPASKLKGAIERLEAKRKGAK